MNNFRYAHPLVTEMVTYRDTIRRGGGRCIPCIAVVATGV